MTNIIFLDIDGVLNCELFYKEKFEGKITFMDNVPLYKQVKKFLKKWVKAKEMTSEEYYKSMMCPKRMSWLNDLCKETDSKVVVSASMRGRKTVEELQTIFNASGATFEIIDKTGHNDSGIRGVEIYQWLKDNCHHYFGVDYYDFYRYVIIDDDSDMLLWQQDHFFKTDNYSGLTPNTCYRIKRFLTHKIF